MADRKHTPGPWRVFTPDGYEGPSSLPGLGIENHEGKAVVWYAAEPETGLENDHDAHLIAAAPELLEALKDVSQALAGYMPESVEDSVKVFWIQTLCWIKPAPPSPRPPAKPNPTPPTLPGQAAPGRRHHEQY